MVPARWTQAIGDKSTKTFIGYRLLNLPPPRLAASEIFAATDIVGATLVRS
jgi:hypothetical protein